MPHYLSHVNTRLSDGTDVRRNNVFEHDETPEILARVNSDFVQVAQPIKPGEAPAPVAAPPSLEEQDAKAKKRAKDAAAALASSETPS